MRKTSASKTLQNWIANTTKLASGLVVPVSGGTDSALVFKLCCLVYPQRGKVVGLHIGTNLRCREWFESVGEIREVDLPAVEGIIPEAMRWAKFTSVCWEEDRWLFGSRNRTEEVLDTFSMPSRLSSYLPLDNVWKCTVMKLAEHLGVPSEILQSSRVEDLDCGRPPELTRLEDVDLFAQVMVGERPEKDLQAISGAQHDWLSAVYKRNRFKAALPMRGPIV